MYVTVILLALLVIVLTLISIVKALELLIFLKGEKDV